MQISFIFTFPLLTQPQFAIELSISFFTFKILLFFLSVLSNAEKDNKSRFFSYIYLFKSHKTFYAVDTQHRESISLNSILKSEFVISNFSNWLFLYLRSHVSQSFEFSNFQIIVWREISLL